MSYKINLNVGVTDHTDRSNYGAAGSRLDRDIAKESAKSRHATIRAERRRKRKAKQARKFGSLDTAERQRIGKRRAYAWVAFCGASVRK